MIAHTEGAHGRTGVHRGALAWERYRSQEGMLTTGRVVHETYYDTEQMYNSEDDMWECPVCYKSWSDEQDLERHLSSGVHEDARYETMPCIPCRSRPDGHSPLSFSSHTLSISLPFFLTREPPPPFCSYRCNDCGKKFTSLSGQRQHLQVLPSPMTLPRHAVCCSSHVP